MESEYGKITYYRFDDREREELLEKLRSFLASDERIKLTYLKLHSRKLRQGSGCGDLRDPSFFFRRTLRSRIELKLGLPIDLMQLQDLAPTLRYKVLGYGLPIISKDNKLRYRLMAQAFSELQDLAICRRWLLLAFQGLKINDLIYFQ